MKQLRCPLNGLRPLQEFTYGGEFRETPDTSGGGVSDEQWADYVYLRDGEPAIKKEWWYHNASSTWFLAERDNITDKIVRTYLYSEGGHE